MKDDPGKPAAADDSAATPELTDEQIWNEMVGNDSATDQDDPPEDDADEGDPPEDAEDDGQAEKTPDDPPDSSDDEADKPDDAEDPWAKAPPELLKEREKMEHSIRSLNGRVRALTKKIQQAPQGASDEDKQALAAAKQALTEKAEEYPDILKPVLDNLNRIDTKLEAFEQASTKEREDLIQAEWETFTELRSDGMAVVEKNADAFNAWVQDQPKTVRDIVEANKAAIVDGAGAAEVISAFEKHLNAAQQPPATDTPPASRDGKRERQLRGAQGTTSRSARVTTNPDIGQMSDEDYWNYLVAQDEKKKAR